MTTKTINSQARVVYSTQVNYGPWWTFSSTDLADVMKDITGDNITRSQVVAIKHDGTNWVALVII